MSEEGYLPHSYLRRFPDQVQLSPASPSPPSSHSGRSKSGYQRPPSASLSDQLREEPIPSEAQASRETGFPSCFSFTVFLKQSSQTLWWLLKEPGILSVTDTQQLPGKEICPARARARARTLAQRAALSGPRGRRGRREHHPSPRRSRSRRVCRRSSPGKAAWECSADAG